MAYFLNPKIQRSQSCKNWLRLKLEKFLLAFGFLNIHYSYVNGDVKRLKIGSGCSTANTLFNTVCGNISVGNDTIFGHNCMVLTGRHRFYKGKRAKLVPNSEHYRETPEEGYDIEIGSGCFIASNAIILAPVKIGNNVIIGAGSLVIKDVPDNCFVAGSPAKIISFHHND